MFPFFKKQEVKDDKKVLSQKQINQLRMYMIHYQMIHR